MKLLYSRAKGENQQIEKKLDIKAFSPSIFKKLYLLTEKRNFKTTIVRAYFYLMTLGKATIYYVYSGKVIHTSYVVPRCFKFPFLKKKDFIIGPCFTHSDFRGQGIYPTVINHIVNNVGAENSRFYMVVDSENLPSVRGIEKAGFERCGEIIKTKVLKRYYIK